MEAVTGSELDGYSDEVSRCYSYSRDPRSCVASLDRASASRDGEAIRECDSVLSRDARGHDWCRQEVAVQIAGRIGVSACYASISVRDSDALTSCIDAEAAAAADGTYGGKNIAAAWTAACYAEFGPGASNPDPAMLQTCLNF